MPAEKYWLWINEQHWGPCSVRDILRLGGREDPDDPEEVPFVTRETLFWSEKANEWRPIYRLPEEWQADEEDKAANQWGDEFKYFEFRAYDGCDECQANDFQIVFSASPPKQPRDGCQCLYPRGSWYVVTKEDAEIPIEVKRQESVKRAERDRISAKAHAEALKARQKEQRKAKREAQKAQNKHC